MIEVWSCPTLSCIASFLIHITNYKTAPFSAPLFSVLLYVYNVNIPAKFEARPTLRLQYCPLRIKKIQNFEEEHKHIFSQGTSTCQILRHLDMDPMTLHQLYYIADGEEDGWICIQPDNRKMVIVTDDIGVNFIAYGTKKE
ncbi:unnamed protein product [Brassica rapa subsp. trilocularis]